MSSGTAVAILSAFVTGVFCAVGIHAYYDGNFKRFNDGPLGQFQHAVHGLVKAVDAIMIDMDRIIHRPSLKWLKIKSGVFVTGDLAKLTAAVNNITDDWPTKADDLMNTARSRVESGFFDDDKQVALSDDDKVVLAQLVRKVRDHVEMLEQKTTELVGPFGALLMDVDALMKDADALTTQLQVTNDRSELEALVNRIIGGFGKRVSDFEAAVEAILTTGFSDAEVPLTDGNKALLAKLGANVAATTEKLVAKATEALATVAAQSGGGKKQQQQRAAKQERDEWLARLKHKQQL
jgi:hypothetical protein